MKNYLLAISILIIAGCCSTLPTGVEQGSTTVHPPAISDSLANALGFITSEDCKDAVQEAIINVGNYAQSKIDEMGDSIAFAAQVRIDSIRAVADSAKGVKVYITRTVRVYVQPRDSVIVYPVQRIVPMSWFDKFKLTAFWPLVILLFGVVGLVAFYQLVLQNPSKAVSTVDDIIHRI